MNASNWGINASTLPWVALVGNVPNLAENGSLALTPVRKTLSKMGKDLRDNVPNIFSFSPALPSLPPLEVKTGIS